MHRLKKKNYIEILVCSFQKKKMVITGSDWEFVSSWVKATIVVCDSRQKTQRSESNLIAKKIYL